MAKQELSWTNITRADMDKVAQDAFDMFLTAKKELEERLAMQAIVAGSAAQGDTFRFAYRSIGQGSIGMAIDAPSKGQASGFAGLQRPADKREQEAVKLAAWLEERKAQGRRF